MLDHILGKPSANIRRTQVLGTALLTAILLQRQKRAPWGLRWLAQLDTKLPIWKALLCWSTILYVLRHMDDLLGLHAPEPLREYYSRSFYRATWIFTALDAGFWTAMSVRPRPLRHILSLLFSVYYLIFTNRGVEKVRKVRALITVDHLRVSWNKGVDNPLLRLIMRLRSSKLTVNRVVSIPLEAPAMDTASDGSQSRLSDVAQLEPAKCHIMYAGPEGEFKSCRHVVLNFPGGGFVAMGPDCHKDYLSAWAERTQAVVVSVDYAKAPEYPYPYAIDQCYEVYRDIVQTNGRCLGLQQPEPLRIVLAGDSAGGNITASVMFRILESSDRLPVPEGIVFIYGCFNVDICAWMTRQETRMLLGASESVPVDSKRSHESLSSLVSNRNHLHHVSPLAVTNRDDGYCRQDESKSDKHNSKRPVYVDDRVRVVRKTAAAPLSRNSSDDEDDEDKNNGNIRSSDSSGSDVERAFVPAQTSKEIGYVPLSMTSSFTYFNDQILSPEMMRAMIIMYVGPNGRPNFRTDYYLSPLVAPDHLLERFPPVYFMCGEKDPMVDDTVLFAARIRKAKQRRMQAASPAKKPNKGDRRPLAAGVESSGANGVNVINSARNQYRDFKSSKLYSRRHSQPRLHRETNFYIGSTDVSDNDEDQSMLKAPADTSTTSASAAAAAGALRQKLPASLRMSHIPTPQASAAHHSRSAARSRAEEIAESAPATVIKVKLLAGMSHGFMQMYSLLPESKQVAATLGGWLVELLYGDHTMTAYSRCASMVYNSGPHCQQQQQQQLHGADYVSSSSSSSWEIGPNVGNIVLRNGHGPNRHRSVVDDLISIEITSPPLPSTSPTLAVTAAAASFSMNAAAPGISADIFERGLLDKHGIEIVSSANMVRRRGHGLADPLN
ncbi:hypothetical protein GGF37_000759 [Kickxella alabastrina]|nr:hypothetical protein GGF37_000759 [Kickxella alabastrina]